MPRTGTDRAPRSGSPTGSPCWTGFASRVAELLHAPAGSTAIAPSVSVGLTTLASGLPLPPGRDKVLIGGLDFPTVGHQWLSRPGFEVEFVPQRDGMTIPPEAFAERIDARTALVATTHLFYTTATCRTYARSPTPPTPAGALCLIDGYQTCGCVPLDVEAMGCDAFVGGCLKWLSGGPGNAFVYVRPDLIPQMRPSGHGLVCDP